MPALGALRALKLMNCMIRDGSSALYASALIPGQADAAPAADLVALAMGVLVAFKAFKNVVTGSITGLGRGACGIVRTGTRAADEHQ